MARAKSYKLFGRRRRLWPTIVVCVVIILALIVGVVRETYTNNLKPVSSSQTTSYFTVQLGDSVKIIAANLKDAGLIRSPGAFETYVRGHGYREQLQAGTYVLSPSMNVQNIVNKMISGDVAHNLLTILPGKSLDQIKKTFAKAGYADTEIATALDTAAYSGDPVLASLPKGAS